MVKWSWYFVLIAAVFGFSARAATLKVQLTVEIEVFASPDLKSTVIEKVPAGAYVTMRTDKVVGTGGIGVFYKIKTQKGKIGYVVDADLPTSGENMPKPVAPAPPKPKEIIVQVPAPKKSRSQSSAWGLSLGAANLTEKFEGKSYGATQLFFGGRWAGRGQAFLGGRPDLGLVVSPYAPKYLSSAGASGKTSGFVVLSDLSLLYDLAGGEGFAVFAGAGPLLGYSKYSTQYAGESKSSSHFKAGAVADLGMAFGFSSGFARVDIRYFLESTSYVGGFVSLMLYL